MTQSSDARPTSTTGEPNRPTGVGVGGGAHPGSGASGIFTGPAGASASMPTALPTGSLVTWGVVGGSIAGVVVGGVFAGLGRQGAVAAGGAGMAAGVLGPMALVLGARPWHARGVQHWPFVLLGVQAMSCLLVIAAAILLYFSAPQGSLDRLALVASSGASFIGSWVGMVRVIGAHLRDVTEQAKRAHSQDSSEMASGQ